jgi:chloramphenicol 3-O phosphotransferase
MNEINSKIILLNGTSSSGKTTLALALQEALDEPFCYYASDQLAEAGFRARIDFPEAPTERDRFFAGFHRSIAAFASCHNHLIVEHVIEEPHWAKDLQTLLAPFEVLWVGVHAPLHLLVHREQQRGNRRPGEARYHLKTHQYCTYDLEIDSTLPLPYQVALVRNACLSRFDRGTINQKQQ